MAATSAMNGELSGNALVTGGSRGIGRSCALAAAHRGADVAITYVANDEAAEATAEEIRALGRRAIDRSRATSASPPTTSPRSRRRSPSSARSATSSPTRPTAPSALTDETDESSSGTTTMETHVRSLLGARPGGARPRWREAGGGAIVAISSLGAHRVYDAYAAFGTAKAAIETLVTLPRGRGRSERDPRQLHPRRRRPHRPLQRNPRVGSDRRRGGRALAARRAPSTRTRSASRPPSCSPTKHAWSPARRSASTPASRSPAEPVPDRKADTRWTSPPPKTVADQRDHDGVLRGGRGPGRCCSCTASPSSPTPGATRSTAIVDGRLPRDRPRASAATPAPTPPRTRRPTASRTWSPT